MKWKGSTDLLRNLSCQHSLESQCPQGSGLLWLDQGDPAQDNGREIKLRKDKVLRQQQDEEVPKYLNAPNSTRINLLNYLLQ